MKKYKFQDEEAERMKREFRNSNKNEFWKIIKKSVTNASDKTSIPPAESWPEFIESKMTEREETDSRRKPCGIPSKGRRLQTTAAFHR